jgi:hypothetical protein
MFPSSCVIPGARAFRGLLSESQLQIKHSGTMVRAASYREAGGYRPDLRYAVDIALWPLLCLEGDAGYVRATGYGYRIHANQMSYSPTGVAQISREAVISVDAACLRASGRIPGLAKLRRKAIAFQLAAPALDDAFSGRRKLALFRCKTAICLQPAIMIRTRGLWVAALRALLGNGAFEALRNVGGRRRRSRSQGIAIPGRST